MSNQYNRNKNSSKHNSNKIYPDPPIPTDEELIKCMMLQKMNYHISQLPFAPKCPDAPVLYQQQLPNITTNESNDQQMKY